MGLTFFPQQWRAVSAPVGPLLVLAGPGAGKTRCLTGRIAYLIQHYGADPQRICALTFTNKAANEVAHRLRHGLGPVAEQLSLGTLHKLSLELLQPAYHRVGLPAGFGVADEQYQSFVLQRLGVHSAKHRAVLRLFGQRRLTGERLDRPDEELFWKYERELRTNYLIDFDEIISRTRKLLEMSEQVLTEYQSRWDHILVDEFQDLDLNQYRILALLAARHRSLFAVGDDEQSIFAWRGADPRVITRFLSEFDLTEPIVLNINCRCSRTIFETARRILPQGELPFDKPIVAIRESPFDVRVQGFADELAEADWLVRDLTADWKASRLPAGEFAILYRRHTAGQLLEQSLIAAGVRCRMAKGQALSDDPIIARVLAALRVVRHPDAERHVEHLATLLLPDAVLSVVLRSSGSKGFLDRLRSHAQTPGVADADKCWRFLYQVENFKGLLRGVGGVAELIEAVLAQGVAGGERPLEAHRSCLADPEEVPDARSLADQLCAAAERGDRIVLAPVGGLEVPAKQMLCRVLPDLVVEYQATCAVPGRDDFLLDLESPGDGLRITRLFKALQVIEGRRFRKLFTEYVVFDTETTGTDVDQDDVIELSAVHVREGVIVREFETLLRIERPIPRQATAVHHIRDEDLLGQPTLAEQWPKFREFVGDRMLVVHNGYRFDVPLLRRLTRDLGGLEGLSVFDTLPLARNLFPSGRASLQELARRFQVDPGRMHRASDDCRCLMGVFEQLQSEYLRRARTTCLGDILDCVALGIAIEGRQPTLPEDQAMLQAAAWHELRRRPAVVDLYVEESPALGPTCPPLEAILHTIGGSPWKGGRGRGAVPERHADACARLFNLVDRLRSTTVADGVGELLDMAALSTSEGPTVDADRVNLLTFHSAKGLEFSHLYVIGVEDNELPGWNARTLNEINEARRLLYVAMTRAKDRLTLTHCRQRGGKSTGGTKFLEEMGLRQGSSRVAVGGGLVSS
jgi:DNA polymerase III epsilon subunit family exonuclease